MTGVYHQPYCPTWEHEHPETEDAIADAVMRWVGRHFDATTRFVQANGGAAAMNGARFLEGHLRFDRDAVAREVLAALRDEET